MTLVRDRNAMLDRFLAGCARQSRPGLEVVIVTAGGREDPATVAARHPTVTTTVTCVSDAGETIPYSAARNHGAAVARSDQLVFCDADTIPATGFAAAMEDALEVHDALATGEVRYLRPGAETAADDGALRAASLTHPDRDPVPTRGVRLGGRHELVWGLCMALRRRTFDALGGFDTGYSGYAGEDTDLATRAASQGLPVALVGGAVLYHQHHDWFDPPIHQLAATVANATRYRSRWGRWPMEGWLAAFAAMGLIEWTPEADRCVVRREPTPEEIAACRRDVAAPFLPQP